MHFSKKWECPQVDAFYTDIGKLRGVIMENLCISGDLVAVLSRSLPDCRRLPRRSVAVLERISLVGVQHKKEV
jgi:hypothetical protein